MLQSYINISITADGPKEKAAFPKPTDSFQHTVEVHRNEESSPVKSEANNTGLCPSDSIGLEVVIPKSEQCSIKGNKADKKLQIDDPDDMEKSLTISNCMGNRDETPKVSTTKDDQILVAPPAECEMNGQSADHDNNCDVSNNNSCLISDSYSTLINSISSNSSIC
ncbi:hypothetical protein LSH36_759g01030 [Paralvinella palmiformis]|uniref:Uncharacterized protein n=1 Tax=Paralvinella palmiformis TaxID=53620 RepID=A0AAD9J142_9ANNE|nr:hypothetical protein LSH36_759g01030 [Paralvinella palmiformis]